MSDNALLSRRGRRNALKRYRTDDDPALIEADRDLAAEALAEHVRRVVAAAPQLTTAQCDRIAALLRPSVQDGRAAG